MSSSGNPPQYSYVKASGNTYYSNDGSTFTIPVELNKNNRILGMTTKMSSAHEIEYIIFVQLKTNANNQKDNTDGKTLSTEAPEIMGLTFREEIKLEHAQYLKLFRYEGNIVLAEIDVISDTVLDTDEAKTEIAKADSAAAIAALREMGCDVVLLTGDNQRTADAIARQVGVSRVIAQVLPQDKARVVQELQAEGKKVAMVGDGINDAPALVTADVGLAIGVGTDVAIESADIVLMKSSLMDIADAAALSRATLRNIRRNLFWAFFYNSVGIPVAAGVLYPAFGITLNPMIAAAAMSLSSVCVVSNALRLRGWRGRRREGTPTAKEPQLVQNINNNESSKEDTAMKKTITIKGMMCAHCVSHVEKALTALGVQADVDLASGTAVVTGNASDEALKKAVTDAGYEVVEIK